MSITNWTSEDMDWNDVRMVCPYPYLSAVILALNERLMVAGSSTLSIDLLSSTYEACHAIDAAIDAVIGKYINHTDNDGEWEGLAITTPIPKWTEAKILETIDAESRIKAAKLSHMSSDWLKQQYQIINLLRWVDASDSNKFSSYGREYTMDGNSYRSIGQGATQNDAYANAEAFFNNDANWYAWPNYVGFLDEAGTYYVVFGLYNPPRFPTQTYDLWIYTRFKKWAGIYRNTSAFEFTIKYYAGAYTPPNDNKMFYEFMAGAQQDKWFCPATATIAAGGTTPVTIAPLLIPNSIAGSGEYTVTFSDKVGVLKFDGPNGFKFKDW